MPLNYTITKESPVNSDVTWRPAHEFVDGELFLTKRLTNLPTTSDDDENEDTLEPVCFLKLSNGAIKFNDTRRPEDDDLDDYQLEFVSEKLLHLKPYAECREWHGTVNIKINLEK